MRERLTYNLASAEAILAEFESRYGMASADFYERYRADDVPGVNGRSRAAWAHWYRAAERMRSTGGPVADSAARLVAAV